MSFELGFCKDIFLNKLGAAKDRAAAVLRQLDRFDGQLRVINTASRGNTINMPVVRSRSKSKCKHSYSHKEERLYGPRYYDDWSSDDGYDSDCSCGDHITGSRGRKSHRDADIYIDGGNADQQNVLIKPCCGGKCKHVHRRRPRSRSVIIVDRPRSGYYHEPIRRPCHPDGHCCIHGTGYHDFCHRCPSGSRMWAPRYQHQMSSQQNLHRVITDDDGKVNFYDSTKLSKFLCDQAQAYAKAEAEKKSASDKQTSEAMSMLSKMCKPDLMGGGCGCGGYLHSCGVYKSSRSAQAVENELAEVNADLDQLHARVLLDAHVQALTDCTDDHSMGELAMCSGALQESHNDGRVAQHSDSLRQRPLKSILAPKKVSFAGNSDYSARCIEEIDDDDDGFSMTGKADRCCARCT